MEGLHSLLIKRFPVALYYLIEKIWGLRFCFFDFEECVSGIVLKSLPSHCKALFLGIFWIFVGICHDV